MGRDDKQLKQYDPRADQSKKVLKISGSDIPVIFPTVVAREDRPVAVTTEDRIDAYLRNRRLPFVGKQSFKRPLYVTFLLIGIVVSDTCVEQSVGETSALIILEDLRKKL